MRRGCGCPSTRRRRRRRGRCWRCSSGCRCEAVVISTLTRSRPGSLPIVLLRHLGALVVAGVLVTLAGQLSPIIDQPILWLAAAAVAGALGGLVDRGWLGLLFVEVGIGLGIALDLAASHRDTHEATVALASAAALYVATFLAGAAAYLIARMVRRQLS